MLNENTHLARSIRTTNEKQHTKPKPNNRTRKISKQIKKQNNGS